MSSDPRLRLSPSSVGDYTNCPQLYKYRSIDKLPQPPNLDAERGTLVHTVLHDLFESLPADRTVSTAVDLLPSRWRAQVGAKPELAQLVSDEKEWLDRASSLVKTYFTLEHPESFEATHREMHLELGLLHKLGTFLLSIFLLELLI